MKYKLSAPLLVLAMAIPAMAIADHNLPEGNETATPATHEEACEIHTNLSIGGRGEEVSCLQEHLIEEGLLSISTPTGYFGEMTKAAVMEWQEEKGLPATGFFGAMSRAAFSEHAKSAKSAHGEAAAVHPTIDVATWPSVPTVHITVHTDAMSGWNLEIVTTNFAFAPQHVNGKVVPNEGHAHVMINGKKLARVYGNWFHIPKEAVVGKGEHELLVTLNANDHSELAHNGARIEAKAHITVN